MKKFSIYFNVLVQCLRCRIRGLVFAAWSFHVSAIWFWFWQYFLLIKMKLIRVFRRLMLNKYQPPPLLLWLLLFSSGKRHNFSIWLQKNVSITYSCYKIRHLHGFWVFSLLTYFLIIKNNTYSLFLWHIPPN